MTLGQVPMYLLSSPNIAGLPIMPGAKRKTFPLPLQLEHCRSASWVLRPWQAVQSPPHTISFNKISPPYYRLTRNLKCRDYTLHEFDSYRFFFGPFRKYSAVSFELPSRLLGLFLLLSHRCVSLCEQYLLWLYHRPGYYRVNNNSLSNVVIILCTDIRATITSRRCFKPLPLIKFLEIQQSVRLLGHIRLDCDLRSLDLEWVVPSSKFDRFTNWNERLLAVSAIEVRLRVPFCICSQCCPN